MPYKHVAAIRNDISPHWVGDGFPVRTMFSYRDEGVDPFLMLDYAEPYRFPPRQKPNFSRRASAAWMQAMVSSPGSVGSFTPK